MRIFFVLPFVIIQSMSHALEPCAPQYEWTRSFGGFGGGQGYGIVVTADGGVVVTGRFGVTNTPKGDAIDFDPTEGEDFHSSQGGIDLFVTKLHADGSYAWTRTIGGPGAQESTDIAIDQDGNILVVGHFYTTVDFDPTDGVDVRVSNGAGDAFVTKISADGAYVWTWTAGGPEPGAVDVARGVTVNAVGDVFIAGHFYGVVDFDQVATGDVRESQGQTDAFVTKLRADGTYSWTWIAAGTLGENASCLAIDDSGDVFVAGSFSSATADFDPAGQGDVHVSNGSGDVFVTKLHSDGSYGWTSTFGGTLGDYVSSGLDATDHVLIAGRFGLYGEPPGYSVDFDPSDGVDMHATNGGSDMFVMKLGTDGSYEWTRTFGGALDVSLGPHGNIIVAGLFRGVVDFDPTEGVDEHSVTGNAEQTDLFITNLRPDGLYNWTWSAGGSQDDTAYVVDVDSEGHIFATGYFVGEVDFDATDDGEDVHNAVSGSRVFVTQLLNDVLQPVIVHASGLPSETRPFSGYVDSRAESTNGEFVDLGITEVVMVFSELVQADQGGPLDATSFSITTTGGDAPSVTEVDDSENPLIRITLDSIPPLQEWTTITASVSDACGNPIENLGNLGPGIEEPDRIDFLFLPADVDQSGDVGPFDLLRFRQIVNEIVVPTHGTVEDYVDTNRTGEVTPFDLLMYRQLINGTIPATRIWAGETANHPQP